MSRDTALAVAGLVVLTIGVVFLIWLGPTVNRQPGCKGYSAPWCVTSPISRKTLT